MNDFYKEYLKASTLGLEVGFSLIAGGVLGYIAELYVKITPWGLIIGICLGIAAAAKTLYRFSKKYLKENN